MQETTQSRETYWQEKVADFKKSGLSRAAYCRAHNLKLTTFKNWCYRSRHPNKEKPGKPTDFVPLLTKKCLEPTNATTAKYYRLHIKEGIYIEIPLSLPLSTLEDLLRLAGRLSW